MCAKYINMMVQTVCIFFFCILATVLQMSMRGNCTLTCRTEAKIWRNHPLSGASDVKTDEYATILTLYTVTLDISATEHSLVLLGKL